MEGAGTRPGRRQSQDDDACPASTSGSPAGRLIWCSQWTILRPLANEIPAPVSLGRSGCLRSPTRELDALEGEHLGQPIEVRIVVKYSQPTVLGGGGGYQRVRGRHPVVPVAPLGELAKRAHRCIGDGA